MTFSNQKIVFVYYTGLEKKYLMGRLLFKDRQLLFEYDPDFIALGLQLSPFKLPLNPGIITSKDATFDGLFGVFNDSTPDGWGRLLLDRKIMRLGYHPGNLSVLDRLCFVGTHGMGALVYEPQTPIFTNENLTDLDQIDQEIENYQERQNYEHIDTLIALGGSSAGARPKILIRLNDTNWLIKFRSSLDPKDISTIEYAYHLMASHAGLNVPKARLFPSKTGTGFFGVERFDKTQDDTPVHMHTISGLLHADHRLSSLDYETIIKTTLFLTKDTKECEQQFRNAIFNILSHNRDDHAKNFSFLMDKNGKWKVSPAYDLTFSFGPMGEHATTLMGEGKIPTKEHALELAKLTPLSRNTANSIIEEVMHSVSKWKIFAEQAGVSSANSKMIAKGLSSVMKNFIS